MMTDWRKTAGFIGLDVPLWKAHVFDYLEAAGMVFCVHFGINNAVDKARQHWSERKKLRKNSRKLPLGLSVLFLLGLAAPASAIVMAQKDLPLPPCGCVWDFVNNPLDDPIQTLAEQEEDRLHEGDPDWFLVCVPDLVPTGPAIVIYVPPNLPPVGVTPYGPPVNGVPFTVPPGGPETPPEGPPVQTPESATLALLLAGLLVLRVRW